MSKFNEIPYLIFLFTIINISLVVLLAYLWGKIFNVQQYQAEKIQPRFAASIGGLEAMKEVGSID